MHLFFTCLHFLWTLRIPVKTHALIFYVPYMFIFHVICTSPLSTSFHVAFFGFQTRKTSRFSAYVLLWEIMFDTWQLLKYIEHLTEMQGFCQKIVNFFSFFVSQLGDFSIDQMKFACWAQEVRITSLQRCYSISDVERALQLLQPTVASRLSLFYYLFLWILTGYSFQKSFSSGH